MTASFLRSPRIQPPKPMNLPVLELRRTSAVPTLSCWCGEKQTEPTGVSVEAGQAPGPTVGLADY